MPRIPGTFNGDGEHHNPNIPPVVEWDENDPQTFYNCTNEIFHRPDCDRECGEYEATEGWTNVVNEERAWARLRVPMQIEVDQMDVMLRIELMQEMLLDLSDMDRDEYEERLRLNKATRLKVMRLQIEPQVKEAVSKAKLAVARKRIIGPNGELLGQ